jgi:hypothetical protein
VKGTTTALVVLGLGLGAVAALGAAAALDAIEWGSLAALAAALLSYGLVALIGAPPPRPRPERPAPPRTIDRVRSAAAGDPLARQFVFESLDRLTPPRPDAPPSRLARTSELYRLNSTEFDRFLDRALTERERSS